MDQEPTIEEQLKGMTPRSHFERACERLGIEVIIASSSPWRGDISIWV
jgi:hypothetical protein